MTTRSSPGYTLPMAHPARRLATWEDVWEGSRHERRYEVLAGELFEKAAGDGEHSGTQAGMVITLGGPFNRRGGSGPPGGWWLLTEPDVEFEPHEVLRPDLAGWRRERCPERPSGFPVRVVPDWVCEVLSPSTAARDVGHKRTVYHRHGVEWYWLVHPRDHIVTVLRRGVRDYEIAATCGAEGRVRLPPFDAVEVEAARLFGLDPAEEPGEGSGA